MMPARGDVGQCARHARSGEKQGAPPPCSDSTRSNAPLAQGRWWLGCPQTLATLVYTCPRYKLKWHASAGHGALHALPQRTVRAEDQGLLLHRSVALYRAGRSDDLITVKTHDDAKARVVTHLPGQGKHASRLSTLCTLRARMPNMPAGRK